MKKNKKPPNFAIVLEVKAQTLCYVTAANKAEAIAKALVYGSPMLSFQQDKTESALTFLRSLEISLVECSKGQLKLVSISQA